MTPNQFVQKWSQIALNEIAMAQSHFNDVCALVGHMTPVEADPTGEFFTFEAPAHKGGVEFGRQKPDGVEQAIPPHLEDDLAKEAAIAEAARQLDAFCNAWLFPPEDEISVTISDSMLKKRTLTNLYNALADYREKVKGRNRDADAWYRMVKGLIGLDEIETLDHIHNELDRAVLAAYGWPAHLSDEEILERLLEENLRRASGAR